MSVAPESFDEVFGPLVTQGYALAFTMLNDRDEAQDAVQEASFNAWRRLSSLRGRDAVKPWFLSIVANECRNIRRGRWQSVIKLAEIRRRRQDTEWASAERLDLDQALDRLDASDRALLFLHYNLDLTFEQSAAILGISMTAARSRIYRALDRLRSSLGPEGALANG
jgi:RNA polymerase sigma-70 factor (ECF subfamily)